MIIEFSVSNFRSIKEQQSLKLASVKKFSSEELNDNITPANDNYYGITTVKSGVIFGNNASGKSNMLKAIKALNYLVERSMEFKLDESIAAYEPFKLCNKSKINPITFSIDFITSNGIRYFYFIEFTEHKFIKEELYLYPHSPKTRRTILFKRSLGNLVKFGTHYSGKKEFEIYDNQLILSQVGIKPIESLITPFRFFSKHLFCSTIHDTRYDDVIIQSFTKLMHEKSSKFRANINRIIRAADTGVLEIRTKENSEESFKFPEDIPQKLKKDLIEKYKHRIKTVHNLYESELVVGEEIFDIQEESTGTIKLLVVGGLILDALQDGTTLIVDELDKSLHPLISQMLIKLFNSKENNPNNAQLIFATHDISLISRDIFRLDQFYFSEKDYKGASKYFRLSDFTNISKVAPLSKWYLLGRFGAVPMIDEYELSLDLNNSKEYEGEKVH